MIQSSAPPSDQTREKHLHPGKTPCRGRATPSLGTGRFEAAAAAVRRVQESEATEARGKRSAGQRTDLSYGEGFRDKGDHVIPP